jgi:hypothetical protein
MIRRSGNKIYTKVTQYFTDDNSTVGYSHSLTSPTESFCGTNFYYEQRLTSSLANGRWRDCLYGPFTFCSGSTSSSACESGNCNQFYLDTATINIDPTGVMLDETSNVTLYTGSRMYLSSSLELAPDAYYASGSNWYQVGTGNPYGYNMGTIIVSGSCPLPPPTPTATFSHSSGTNTSTSGVGLTTINPTITVTNGPVTIRLRITVITGFRGNTTLIIPGYGSFSPTPQPEGTGDSTFLDITLVNGIYYCTWEINAISQGEFTLVQSFLTQI